MRDSINALPVWIAKIAVWQARIKSPPRPATWNKCRFARDFLDRIRKCNRRRDSAQAVRYYYACCFQSFEAAADYSLCLIIERARRLIKEENAWFAYNGPGNHQTLSACPPERPPPPSLRIVCIPIGIFTNVVIPARRAAFFPGVVYGQLFGADDVGKNISAEQRAILQDNPDLAANRCYVESLSILATRSTPPRRWVFQSPTTNAGIVDLPEPEGRTNAAICPGAIVERNVVQDHRAAGPITKHNSAQSYFAG